MGQQQGVTIGAAAAGQRRCDAVPADAVGQASADGRAEGAGEAAPGPLRNWLARAVVLLLVGDLAVLGLNLYGLGAGGRTASAHTSAVRAGRGAAPDGGPAAARGGVAALLARQADALREHDAAGYAATLDPAAVSAPLRAERAASFARMAAVPFSSWSARLVAVGAFPLTAARLAALAAGDPHAAVVTAQVAYAYGLEGSSGAPVTATAYETFVRRAGRWYLAGTRDGAAAGRPTPPQPWDLGPVAVARGDDCVVLGIGGAGPLQRYVRDVDLAAPTVERLWGNERPPRAVVVVPADAAQATALLGGTAAVTAELPGTAPPGGGAAAVSAGAGPIVVNPGVFGGLTARARRIALTRELARVAMAPDTRAWTPAWLAAGAAEFTAHLGSGEPISGLVADVHPGVAAGRIPARLPSAADLAAASPSAAAAREEAWVACRLVAARWGQSALAALYRAVAAAGPPPPSAPDAAFGRALAEVLHLTPDRFTRQWQDYVARLAV